MFIPSPGYKKIINAITAPAAVVYKDPDCRNALWRRDVTIQPVLTAGSFSLQVSQSIDGVTYTAVGGAIVTNNSINTRTIDCPFVKFDATAVTTGPLSVWIS